MFLSLLVFFAEPGRRYNRLCAHLSSTCLWSPFTQKPHDSGSNQFIHFSSCFFNLQMLNFLLLFWLFSPNSWDLLFIQLMAFSPRSLKQQLQIPTESLKCGISMGNAQRTRSPSEEQRERRCSEPAQSRDLERRSKEQSQILSQMLLQLSTRHKILSRKQLFWAFWIN